MRALAVSYSCLTLAQALSKCSFPGTTSRAHFLSSAAAAFVGSAVLGMDPTECDAASGEDAAGSNNPRYIEKNLEMKYGETPGKVRDDC